VRSAFVDLFLVGEIPARLQSKSPFHVRMEKGLFSCAHNFGELPNNRIAIPGELYKARGSRRADDASLAFVSPFR